MDGGQALPPPREAEGRGDPALNGTELSGSGVDGWVDIHAFLANP